MSVRIVIVGCGFPQLALLKKARALGLYVIGADMNPEAVGVKHTDEFAQVSTTDEDGLAALVQRVGATAITTTGSERALTATAAVAHRLGLPFYADPETVRRCQEKDAMRAGYRQGGVKVPAFAAASTLAEAEAFVERHGYPVVVKPARGWGQRGVSRVDGHEDLAAAFHDAQTLSGSVGLPVAVVEEFLEGREYSVNGWIEDGSLVSYCVTERFTVPGKKPLGVMIAELSPALSLSAEEEALVVEEARRGARALGHSRGPCYSQVVYDKHRGAYLFETAARLGGGFDADVTYLKSGVDLYTRVLGVATGRRDWEAAGQTGPAHGGAVVKFFIGAPGVVAQVAGIDEAMKVPGVREAEIFVGPGGTIHPLTDAAKRAGYVLAEGASPEAAMSAADKALGCIRVEMK